MPVTQKDISPPLKADAETELSICRVSNGYLLSLAQDSVSRQKIARRLHDLTASLRVLRFAHEALESGYRFDDESRDAKLDSMSRALDTVEKECSLLLQVFHSK